MKQDERKTQKTTRAQARMVALRALLRVHMDGGYSNLVLDGALSGAQMDARETALASALFYGVLERELTLDYVISHYSSIPLKKLSPQVRDILRIGLYQLLYMDKIPHSAAVNESVKLARASRQERAAGFINGVLRSFLRDGAVVPPFPEGMSETARLGVQYACPEWLVSLWRKAYGDDTAQALMEALVGRPPLTVRLNPLRVNGVEQLQQELALYKTEARPVEGMPWAAALQPTGSVERLRAFRQGWFHVQDLASQLCCQALQVKPGQRVADVCAAPGGKSFTLAEEMKNQGCLSAFDCHPSRVEVIRKGAERLGLSIIQAAVRDASCPQTPLSDFDRVLCDVPCSGLGILRRKPEIRSKAQEMLDSLPALQYRILCESAKLLKVDGVLVYSTCTLNPAENNLQAQKFLQQHPDFAPQQLQLPAWVTRNEWEPENQLTLMPHIHGTDGFFISAFRRKR